MAKFKSDDLLTDLRKDVEKLLAAGEYIKTGDRNKLVYQVNKEKWSVVQILEHLNAYGRYYLPLLEKSIAENTGGKDAWFNSGFWGSYFTKSMKPTNIYEVKNKMKAMKAYSFANSLNVDTVVNEFIDQQKQLLQLLNSARNTNLNTAKVPITLTQLIKLKLGDALRFLIAHEQRHLIQARNTLKAVGVATDQFPVLMQFVKG